jgi:AhpD family alkylhydroperoxidase
MNGQNPMELFKNEAPEVAEAFDLLINSLVKTKGLEAKTKQLIYIAIKANSGDYFAVAAHVPMAKKLGATRDEIKDAILMTLTTCGIKGVVTCLAGALEIFDKS